MPWLVNGEAKVLASAEVAECRATKRRGLLGRTTIDGAFVLRSCRWVHTIGMKFPIDVAYIDADGVVLKTTRMNRYRVGLPVPSACWIIEADAGAFSRWPLRVGDTVELRDGE